MPYIFNYDLTVASLGFAILLFGRWDELTMWERTAVWFAFASPLLVMVFNIVAPLSFLAGLIVQVRHLTDPATKPIGLSGLGGIGRVAS